MYLGTLIILCLILGLNEALAAALPSLNDNPANYNPLAQTNGGMKTEMINPEELQQSVDEKVVAEGGSIPGEGLWERYGFIDIMVSHPAFKEKIIG